MDTALINCPVCSSAVCAPGECTTAPGWEIEEAGAGVVLIGPLYNFSVWDEDWVVTGEVHKLPIGRWRAVVNVCNPDGYEKPVQLGEFETHTEAAERADACAQRIAAEFGREYEVAIEALLARLAR